MEPRQINEQYTNITEDILLDGFLISPNIIASIHFYNCNIRGYSSKDFSARWQLASRLRSATGLRKIICEGTYIVSIGEISENHRLKNNLTEEQSPRERDKIKAREKLILGIILDDTRLPGYHRSNDKFRSNNPIAESGVFKQFLEYHPSIITIQDRMILRPNARCVYQRSDSCFDLLNSGEKLRTGMKLRYRYRSKTCVLREVTNLTISDPFPDSDFTPMDWAETESENQPRLRSHLTELRENPYMPVLVVDHDYHNQGKNKQRYTIASSLLSPAIQLEDIPERHRSGFMRKSHVDMSTRFARCIVFREALTGDSSSFVDFQFANSMLANLKSIVITKPNLVFGDGSIHLDWSPKSNFASLLKRGPYKALKNRYSLGLIPFSEKTSEFESFSKEVLDFLRKLKCNVEPTIIEPWVLDERGRLNEHKVADSYHSNEFDALLIELPEYSEQAWKSWKRGLTSSNVASQMVARSTYSEYGAQFNVALGLFCALGGLPFGLARSYTGVEVWIGMDTWNEGRLHIAAASVAFNADGLIIGYPNPSVSGGERTDDHTFGEQLRSTIEGVLYECNKSGEKNPTKFGLIRDGIFYENIRIIEEIEVEYGVEFVVCDVQKSGAPKFATNLGDSYDSTQSGTLHWNGNKGYLQTTEQRKGRLAGTPNYIQVRLIRGDVRMEDLMRDIFWLSKIHAGSTQQPGIPIPQFYADKFAKRAGIGVAFNRGFHTNLGIL